MLRQLIKIQRILLREDLALPGFFDLVVLLVADAVSSGLSKLGDIAGTLPLTDFTGSSRFVVTPSTSAMLLLE